MLESLMKRWIVLQSEHKSFRNFSKLSRLTNPLDSLVISVTQFHAGTTHNVIPEQAEIEGTVRSLRHELRGETEED